MRQPNGAVSSETSITRSVMKMTMDDVVSVAVSRRIWIDAPPEDNAFNNAKPSPSTAEDVNATRAPK
jgi:hypothetical protein